MENAKPQKEHAFLGRIVGGWVMTASSGHEGYDPDDPAQRFTETVSSIGGCGSSGTAPARCLTGRR